MKKLILLDRSEKKIVPKKNGSEKKNNPTTFPNEDVKLRVKRKAPLKNSSFWIY